MQFLFIILVFAWEAYEKGTDVHLQADPTKLELLHREYKVKKEDFKQDLKGGVLERVTKLVYLEFYIRSESSSAIQN